MINLAHYKKHKLHSKYKQLINTYPTITAAEMLRSAYTLRTLQQGEHSK